MTKMDAVLEATKEVLDIKLKQKEQLEKRIEFLNSVNAAEFVKETDPKYKQTPLFAETEKELAILQIRETLINVGGAIEGAKSQLEQIAKEKVEQKDE